MAQLWLSLRGSLLEDGEDFAGGKGPGLLKVLIIIFLVLERHQVQQSEATGLCVEVKAVAAGPMAD